MPHRGMHCHHLFCFLAMDPMVPLPFGISNNANKHHSILDEIPHSQPVFDFSSSAWSDPNCIAMGSIVVVVTARLSSSLSPWGPRPTVHPVAPISLQPPRCYLRDIHHLCYCYCWLLNLECPSIFIFPAFSVRPKFSVSSLFSLTKIVTIIAC